LLRICEKPIAQKLLNVALLFKDHVYPQTVVMCEVYDVFAADMQYHDPFRKDCFNKYIAKIED